MDGIIFNLDPEIVKIGPFAIRYYGIIFVIMLFLGYLLWRWQMLRGGYSEDLAERFIIWGVIAVLLGARFGHVFFYHAEEYLADPIRILQFWKGGLASHGATLGLLIALILFAIKNKVHVLEVLDRFTFSAATGAAMVRLGNFLNSEIVGRATDVPWAVRFVRYDNGAVARHPSQIYEFLMGAIILLILYYADKWAGKEKRPRGLLAGVFMTLYFLGRFMVEFFKEPHTLHDSALTMGQYLSILPFLVGIGLLVWAWKNSGRATS